jgi:hypothetical protein
MNYTVGITVSHCVSSTQRRQAPSSFDITAIGIHNAMPKQSFPTRHRPTPIPSIQPPMSHPNP